MKKTLLRKLLKEKEKQEIVILSSRELSHKIKLIMRSHIGRTKPISQSDLFRRLFGNPSNYSDLQVWFLIERLKRAMNWLRRTSYCFVISKRAKHNIYVYFVVKDYEDADIYVSHLNLVKKRINFMQNRCMKAVEKKFWKEL